MNLSFFPSEILRKIGNYCSKQTYEQFSKTSKHIRKSLTQYRVNKLTELQKKDINQILFKIKNGEKEILLSSGTGTGKTIKILSVINELVKRNKKVLIITEKALVQIWTMENEKFNKNRRANILSEMVKMKEFKPPKCTIYEKRLKLTSELLGNYSVVVMSRSTFGGDIYFSSLENTKSHNNRVSDYLKSDDSYQRKLGKKQQLLDTIYKNGWDFIILDDVKCKNKIIRIKDFCPNIVTIRINANVRVKNRNKRSVVGSYQIDSELSKVPHIKTSVKLINTDGLNYLIEKTLIPLKTKEKILIVVNGATRYKRKLGKTCNTFLGEYVKKLKQDFKKDQQVLFVTSDPARIISNISKMKSGVVFGGSRIFTKGHNIYPSKIVILSWHQQLDISYNNIYQLIGRMRRPGSPYTECVLDHYYIFNRGVKSGMDRFIYRRIFEIIKDTTFARLSRWCQPNELNKFFKIPTFEKLIDLYLKYKNLVFELLANKKTSRKLVLFDSCDLAYVKLIYDNLETILNTFENNIEKVIKLLLYFINSTKKKRSEYLDVTSGITLQGVISWLKRELKIPDDKKCKYDNQVLISMKVQELKTICKNNKIKGYSQKRKKDLIEMIMKLKIDN